MKQKNVPIACLRRAGRPMARTPTFNLLYNYHFKIDGDQMMITITIANLVGSLVLAFTVGVLVAYLICDPTSPFK